MSQHNTGASSCLRCPVYVYNCSWEHLKEQLVHPNSNRQPKDIFFRSLSQDRGSPSPWAELLAQPHKHKELANYCSLLQEHYHQSYVRGVYRSLQQSYSISYQDVLMAMDYCEESLQEIDITTFLQTLCGHIRTFKESRKAPNSRESPQPSRSIGETNDGRADTKAVLGSMCSSIEVEESCEAESGGRLHTSTPPSGLSQSKVPEFPLSLLQTQPQCQVYPDLHRIIQNKFMDILSQYFKSVPSNPHYFFYCYPSMKKDVNSEDGVSEKIPSEELLSEAEPATEEDNMSGCCNTSESDTDLVVEYEEHLDSSSHGEDEDHSLTDSNTVNQDQDSFSILDGDSLLEPEVPQLDMPPLSAKE
ncbi:KICSTOR complex protein SZT2 [Nematolebias whitei]|uniref:KICSTOR complex protein SZT2 n=1 Tax=Nematolebias whitei TaxID=451745 RepID=UPI001896EECF|nr:KICSTOR complex protein SZT2 [Nematolebias whitei]